MSIYDEELINLRYNNTYDLMSSLNVSVNDISVIHELINGDMPYDNIEYYFKDMLNILMMDTYKNSNKTLLEFASIYASTSLVPYYTNCIFDYYVRNNSFLANEFLNDELTNIEGFENFSDDIKDLFATISQAYSNIIDKFKIGSNSVINNFIEYDGITVNIASKKFFIFYYNNFYIKGIYSDGSPIVDNNIVDNVEIVEEEVLPKEVKTPRKKKQQSTTQTKQTASKFDINLIFKTINADMYDMFTNGDTSWKKFTNLGLFGTTDDEKVQLINKLEQHIYSTKLYMSSDKDYVLEVKFNYKNA